MTASAPSGTPAPPDPPAAAAATIARASVCRGVRPVNETRATSSARISRFVGDVFGSPLALEALLAFFLESTFLGLWIFGWGRIPKKVHLATLWAAVIGPVVSAYFIIAANSWMQHPVGVVTDDETGRPLQVDFLAVLTNNTALAAFSHAIVAALMVAGALLVGIGLWHLRNRKLAGQPTTDVDQCDDVHSITVPYLLSYLAHGDFSTAVPGVNELQEEYAAVYDETYPADPSFGDQAGEPIDRPDPARRHRGRALLRHGPGRCAGWNG